MREKECANAGMGEWEGRSARMRECGSGERKYQLQSAVAVGRGEWGSSEMQLETKNWNWDGSSAPPLRLCAPARKEEVLK